MRLAFEKSWLEQAIGDEREPTKVAQRIAEHPEFQKLLQEAIIFAQQVTTDKSQQSRIIAEHIVSVVHQSIGEFTTMH